MRWIETGSPAITSLLIFSPYILRRPRVPGTRGAGSRNRAVSRRAWPMMSCPSRSAARISEPRMYQASSSRYSGPRQSPTARSSPLAIASLPALPTLRHKSLTTGTARGRSRQGTTADSVTKDWQSRNVGRLVLAAWSKRTAAPGALAEERGASVSSMIAKHRPATSRRMILHSALIRPSSRNRPRSIIQW